MAQGVITTKGREKLCKAHAGEITLSIITQMAFGNGGLTENGTPIETTGNESSLGNELLRKDIETVTFPILTTGRYAVRLSKEELANQIISEQGLYDAEGDLVAYKTFLGKGKDEDMEFVFEMDEIF